jgi:hypothetical protein
MGHMGAQNGAFYCTPCQALIGMTAQNYGKALILLGISDASRLRGKKAGVFWKQKV